MKLNWLCNVDRSAAPPTPWREVLSGEERKDLWRCTVIGDGKAVSVSAHARHCATRRRAAPWRTRAAVSCVTKAHSPSNATLKTFAPSAPTEWRSVKRNKTFPRCALFNSNVKNLLTITGRHEKPSDISFCLFFFSFQVFFWSWLWRKVIRCEFRRPRIK